jgi:hypothetical protein
MKRKVNKILLIVVSVLVIITLALAIFVPPYAKSYIQKHSKELVGRKILIKDLHLNIFTGKLEVDSLRVYEANDRDLFVTIDTFLVRVKLIKLISSKIEVNELKVIAPYAIIIQNGSHFNYDDLMPKEDTTKTPKAKSSFPKSIVINNILFRKGKLIYKDLQLKNTIAMNELGVTIPQITFEQGNTNAGIHLKIGDKATLNSYLTLNMKTNEYRLNLDIKSLPAEIITPYVKAYYNIGKLEGLVNTNLTFTGNMKHIMDFKIKGTGTGSGINVTNMLGEPVASISVAAVKIDNIYLPTSTYVFDYIHATNANLSFILAPKTNNLTVLFKPEDPKAAATSEPPMTVRIKDLHLTESQITFTDKTLRQPCTLPIQKVDFLARNFDMNGTNEIKTRAAFPEGGIVDFRWKGNMNDLSNQQIVVNLQNLSLKLFSPYCLDYTAFPITTGNLNFVSKNNIRSNNIESMNIVDVYKMKVGDKHKELKPEYKVPLKLALYILKDKDEKIKFDLPVKGSIKDPQFSYKKIIFKTLVNLMVKVAVSPVKFLANTIGLKSGNLEEIAIEPLQSGFTAEQYSQLNDLATIMKSKPEMTLTMTQCVNLKEQIPLYALYLTKERYLSSLKPENKDPFAYEEVQTIKTNDEKFAAYVDTLILKQGKVLGDVSFQDKVNALYIPDTLIANFQSKLALRNEQLKNYLISTEGVPTKNLSILTADKPALDTYTEKAKYKIDMTLPGTEKPTTEDLQSLTESK